MCILIPTGKWTLLDFHGTPIDALNLYICFVLLDIGSGLFYMVFDSWSHLKLEVAKLHKTENECVIINTMYVMKKSFPIVVHNDYLMAFSESDGRIYVFYFSFFSSENIFAWYLFLLNSNILILLQFKLDVL